MFTKAYPHANRLRRISDLRIMQKALGSYAASNNGVYPMSAGSGTYWNSECPLAAGYPGGSLPAEEVIPGLVPTYLPTIPHDPEMDISKINNGVRGSCCYMYKSDGKDYKIMDFNCQTAQYADSQFKTMNMVDPCRPGPNMPSFAIGVWSPGALVCNAKSPANGW